MWASSFATSNVHDQLKAQQITMPAAATLTTPEMKAQLSQYAGQDMTTGAQAKAYADYYIQEHMNAQADGKTYSQISGEYMAASKADPTAQATQDLGALRQSLFMGTTLRGMLLNAYAFATLGTIAMWAAIAAFIGSAVMFVPGALGIRHAHEVEGSTPPPSRASRRPRDRHPPSDPAAPAPRTVRSPRPRSTPVGRGFGVPGRRPALEGPFSRTGFPSSVGGIVSRRAPAGLLEGSAARHRRRASGSPVPACVDTARPGRRRRPAPRTREARRDDEPHRPRPSRCREAAPTTTVRATTTSWSTSSGRVTWSRSR